MQRCVPTTMNQRHTQSSGWLPMTLDLLSGYWPAITDFHFASIAKPLYHLTEQFVWNTESREALCHKLSTRPVYACPPKLSMAGHRCQQYCPRCSSVQVGLDGKAYPKLNETTARNRLRIDGSSKFLRTRGAATMVAGAAARVQF